MLRAALPLGVTKDGDGIIENGAVYDAVLVLVAARNSKVGRNERDRVKSRCMEAEQRLRDEKLKHVNLLNCICAARNEHARKSVSYCHEAKVSEIKVKTSSAKAKLLALSKVRFVSTHFK